jgi:ABC-2 type transport system permease protein
MKKILIIALKDLKLAFRDRTALILMLAAPFILTLGMGFVTGRISGSGTGGGLSQIELVIVNQDEGPAGEGLVDLFELPALADLVSPTSLSDPAEARRQVDEDKTSAAVIIPAGFSQSLSPEVEPMVIELYTNPTRPTSSGVIKAILEEYSQGLAARQVTAQVTVSQLVRFGYMAAPEAAFLAAQAAAAGGASASPSIRLDTVMSGREAVEFDVLAYLAPGMALMFLMFTVSSGGRSLLGEQTLGTLPRLLVTPIRMAQVLGGKVFGILLTGAAQMFILIGASTLLFGLQWGDLLGVVALVLAAVVGATGWGMIITALARSPGQVSGIGSAMMLTFGIMGGSFADLSNMGPVIQAFSKITPNAWGLTGFTILAQGGSLAEIGGPIGALLLMGAVLFGTAVIIINRRGFAQA